MIAFIRKNYSSMTNQEMADHFGIKIQALRPILYELGYKRIELQYWTKEQIDWLISNYRVMGDKEIAENFNRLFHKKKRWTLKHIEKKRSYLKLKRTRTELKAIKERNRKNGAWAMCASKRWDKTGRAKEGEIRYWRRIDGKMIPYIKVNGRFVPWNRWAVGRGAEGMNVIFKDGNHRNLSPDNLEIITNAEHARRNSQKSSIGLSDNYVLGLMTFSNKEARALLKEESEIIQAKRDQILLNRKINLLIDEKQNKRSA